MARVLVYAVPFGFGPISKAIFIAKTVSEHHTVTIATCLDAFTLLQQAAGRWTAINTHTRNPNQWLEPLINEFDAFVVLMEPRLAEYLASRGLGRKVVFVDSLVCWRDEFTFSRNIRHYVAQYFPGIEFAAVQIAANQTWIVGPLVERQEVFIDRLASNRILLSFGGVSSPVVGFSDYLNYLIGVVRMFRQAIEPYELRLIVGGNRKLLETLQASDAWPQWVCFKSMDPAAFLNEVRQCRCVFAAPGIETAYEAISAKVPLVLLPAMNSTQALQLTVLVASNIASCCSMEHMNEVRRTLRLISWPHQTRRLAEWLELNSAEAVCGVNSILSAVGTQKYPTWLRERLQAQDTLLPDGLPDGIQIILSILREIVTGTDS